MSIAPVMAEPREPSEIASDPGAPIARDQIDPDLVKLARTRPRVGVITAAGLVFLSVLFLIRLGPDRRFAGRDATPEPVQLADVLAGKVDTDRLVVLAADPLVAHAIRTTTSKGSLGRRVVPVRGSGDRLWLAISGDGWEAPALNGYVGRLRRFDDLPLAPWTRAYAAEHPRPVFATAAAVRAGLPAGAVTTVAGDQVTPADGDAVALDVVDPDAATVAASFNDRLPDPAAWTAALRAAGLTPVSAGAPDDALGQIRFAIGASVATTTARLEGAGLWAARVEPVTRHYQTTWGALRRSYRCIASRAVAEAAETRAGADGSAGVAGDLGRRSVLDVGGSVLPDAQIELVGLYVARGIPGDAYALVTGELPDDYWYIPWVTVALAAIALVFAWALVRAIRRDFLPVRAA